MVTLIVPGPTSGTASSLAAGTYAAQLAANNALGRGPLSASVPFTVTAPSGGKTYARGVNSAGADFGNRASSANGTYDGDASFAFYKQRGCTMIRIPFLWEKMQPTLNGALNTTEESRLLAAVNSCTSRGMIANIDVHNYCRYQKVSGGTTYVIGDGTLSGANLADLWSRLANVFKNNPLVQFGLMNEPHDLSKANWEGAAQQAVTAIRATGATNWIWVGGLVYSSAPAYWSQHPTWFINDPLNRSGPEGHYYFDNPPSGTYNKGGDGSDQAVYNSAVSAANGNLPGKTSNDMHTFCQGAKDRNLRMYVGEIGSKRDGAAITGWNAALDAAYGVLDTFNAYATYWAAGEAWGSGYALSVYSGKPESVVYPVATVVEAHKGSAIDP